MSLPAPSVNQAYCEVSGIDAGSINMFLGQLVDVASDEEKGGLPVLTYVLRHSTSGEYFVFDLGIRPDHDKYPSGPRALIAKMQMILHGSDVPATLERGGLSRENVKRVCISHIHFDHTGAPRAFPNAEILLGAGARQIIEEKGPNFEGNLYVIDTPMERTTFLDPSTEGWKPLGPFPRALDYFGDGSLYIVDAPGHVPGHINVMARTSADGGWVYLAGDSAHDWRLLTGEAGIGFHGVFGCIHEDPALAQENIERIKSLKDIPRVRVLLAHDRPFSEEGKGFWPEKIKSL